MATWLVLARVRRLRFRISLALIAWAFFVVAAWHGVDALGWRIGLVLSYLPILAGLVLGGLRAQRPSGLSGESNWGRAFGILSLACLVVGGGLIVAPVTAFAVGVSPSTVDIFPLADNMTTRPHDLGCGSDRVARRTWLP